MMQCFVLTEIHTYSLHRFAIPTWSTSVKSTIHEPAESLIHHQENPQTEVIKKLTSQQIKCGSRPSGVHMSDHTSFKVHTSFKTKYIQELVVEGS